LVRPFRLIRKIILRHEDTFFEIHNEISEKTTFCTKPLEVTQKKPARL
jgi:hypothetical protein